MPHEPKPGWNKKDRFLARWGLVHFIVAIAIGALAATVVALWQFKQDSSRVTDMRQMAQQTQEATQTPPGTQPIGGDFTLVDQDGRTVHDADYRGKYMLVYFGYTYCPDMCPTGLQSMAQALDRLGPDAKKIVPIFITIDPARDTSAKLKTYVAEFHPDIIGLTGSDQQIATAAKAYQVYYSKGEAVDGHDYMMDHSSLIYLMGPDGKFITSFPEEVDADAIVKAVHGNLSAKKP